MGSDGAGQAQKKSGIPVWVWVLIALGAAVPACGVLSALGIYGVRRYVMAAKQAEGRMESAALARGIAACARTAGPDGSPLGLPPSTTPVPASLASVRGAKYASGSVEWHQDAFVCARYARAAPQYFVYQWQKLSEDRGVVSAVADLDGDGVEDQRFEVSVECSSPGDCRVTAAPAPPP